MGETRIQQLAHHEGHAAGRVEGVHVLAAVRIDPRDQRGHAGEVVEVLPSDLDPGGAAHGDQMQGVVGRPSRRQQAGQGVDQALGVDDLRHRRVGVGPVADLHRPLGRSGHQRVAQRGVGMDEGRARQMKTGHLHHHLVGIGGAVEGAGAGPVVGGHLRIQQFLAGGQPLGVERAHLGLLGVGDARGHRAARHEDHRQVAESQGAHGQAGHDLVTDAQHQGRVEGVMGQGHRRRHGDHVAGEQRELHARPALGDAIAHGGHAAGVLGRRPDLAGGGLDDRRETLQRLVGREHVVVGRDDGDVGRGRVAHGRLVGVALGGEGVGPVGAGELGPAGPRGAGGLHIGQVVGAGLPTALDDPFGDFRRDRMHGLSLFSSASRRRGPERGPG